MPFTVIATPVVHTYATPRMIASPRAVPSYDDEYDTSSYVFSNSTLSYQNAMFAFGDWFENASFNVNFLVTPLRLTMATFVLGWLQLASMIFFRDYELAFKSVRCLYCGFYSVSISFCLLFPVGISTHRLNLGLEGTLDVPLRLYHVFHVRPADGEPHHPHRC
jgi:hypothetical protein